MTLTAEQFTGIYTAIPTPISNDEVDTAAVHRLVDFLCRAGIRGLVPAGGTGEYAALSASDRVRLVEATIEAAAGRCKVVAGVLATGFKEAVAAGQDFLKAGADGLMLVTPYYVHGPQAGIRQYFSRYAGTVGTPVVLYEIPRRTGVALQADTIAGMVEDGSIIGMKACNEDMAQFTSLVELVGDRISLLSGEEMLLPAHVALGARGGVIATSSIYPKRWLEIFELMRTGNTVQGLAAHAALAPFLSAAFCEPNPGPLKAALEMIGLPVGDVLLPLQTPSEHTRTRLKAAIDRVGLPD